MYYHLKITILIFITHPMSMFGDINKVTLLGNVTNDPDLRFTPSGTAVLSFSVATNRRYKQNDEWKDEATFHNIVVWRSAEELAKRIEKGTRVLIEGRMQTRSWDDAQTGQKKYKTEVIADDVFLIARYKGGASSELSVPEDSTSDSSSEENTSINPDDLPF
ncbi:MAG: single-stranded DNA-binding protein [Candidatus Dojkabacteria bacterium]